MPLFFFDLLRGTARTADLAGTAHPDLESARRAAQQRLLELMQGQSAGAPMSIAIRDDRGAVLAEITGDAAISARLSRHARGLSDPSEEG